MRQDSLGLRFGRTDMTAAELVFSALKRLEAIEILMLHGEHIGDELTRAQNELAAALQVM